MRFHQAALKRDYFRSQLHHISAELDFGKLNFADQDALESQGFIQNLTSLYHFKQSGHVEILFITQ